MKNNRKIRIGQLPRPLKILSLGFFLAGLIEIAAFCLWVASVGGNFTLEQAGLLSRTALRLASFIGLYVATAVGLLALRGWGFKLTQICLIVCGYLLVFVLTEGFHKSPVFILSLGLVITLVIQKIFMYLERKEIRVLFGLPRQ